MWPFSGEQAPKGQKIQVKQFDPTFYGKVQCSPKKLKKTSVGK